MRDLGAIYFGLQYTLFLINNQRSLYAALKLDSHLPINSSDNKLVTQIMQINAEICKLKAVWSKLEWKCSWKNQIEIYISHLLIAIELSQALKNAILSLHALKIRITGKIWFSSTD